MQRVAPNARKNLITAARQCASYALCVVLLASCIIPVPLPPIPSRAFAEETVKSLHVGMTRAEVLMTFGNPDRREKGDVYFGYWWQVTTHAIIGGIPYLVYHSDVFRRPHILMIEFDQDGCVKRFEGLSQDTWPLLNREVDKWMQPSPQAEK